MEADGIAHLVEKEGDQLVLVAHGNDEARVESIQSLGGQRLRLVESLEESVTRFLDTACHQVGRNLDERVVLELMVGVVLLCVEALRGKGSAVVLIRLKGERLRSVGSDEALDEGENVAEEVDVLFGKREENLAEKRRVVGEREVDTIQSSVNG